MGPSRIVRTVLKCRNWRRLWNILVIFAYLRLVSILSSESSSSSGMWAAQGLEMNVGKIPFLEAVNGSTVMLPCTYASCIGIKNLYFNWQFNDNGTMRKVHHTEKTLDCPGLRGSFGQLTACCSFSGVWVGDIVGGGGATSGNILGPSGVCGQKPWKQHLHFAVEHHLWGRRPIHLFWTQPQREGQEPQCHLHTLCGGQVWVAGKRANWFSLIYVYDQPQR